MIDTWRNTTLGEFAPFRYGKSLTKAKRDGGQYPVVGSGGVNGWHSEALVEGPVVVVGRKGTVGSVQLFKEGAFPIDTTFYVTESDARDQSFTYYLLSSLGMEEMNSDSAVPGLNRDRAHAIKVRVPALEEQRRIAGVLGALDDLISINEQLRNNCVELAKSAIQHAASATSASVRLGDIVSIRRGLSYKGSGLANDGLPMVNMGSAENFGWLKRSGWKHYVGDFKDRHLATSRDLLVVNTEQTWRNEILGWPLLVPADVKEALFTHHVYKLEFRQGWEWARLGVWGALFTPAARAQIDGTVRGTTVANLPVDGLERIQIRLPEPGHPCLATTEALLDNAWAAELAMGEAKTTRDELLPLLLSGRVRVGEVAA